MNIRGKEVEDPSVKTLIKVEATRGLQKHARNNIKTCKSIMESKGFLCLEILIENGKGEVQYNSAMVVMEIETLL